jgi:hypothetical protein
MTPEEAKALRQFIYDNFDFVRKSLDGSMLPFAMFYLEIGDGWLTLIYHLFCDIEDELRLHPELRENFRVSQVKEKFGGLRCYTYGSSEQIEALISNAESLSVHICEQCGETGSRRPMGWIVTLCKKCFWEHIKKNWHQYGFRTKIDYIWSLMIE